MHAAIALIFGLLSTPLYTDYTADQEIPLNKQELDDLMNVNSFIGRAPQQVDAFLINQVYSLIRAG